MRLNEGIIGETYKVTDVCVDGQITRRLEALGVNEQTDITILNKKGSGSLPGRISAAKVGQPWKGLQKKSYDLQQADRKAGFP